MADDKMKYIKKRPADRKRPLIFTGDTGNMHRVPRQDEPGYCYVWDSETDPVGAPDKFNWIDLYRHLLARLANGHAYARQADYERAILDWARDSSLDMSESRARIEARAIMTKIRESEG